MERLPEKQNVYSARGTRLHKSIEDFFTEGKPLDEELAFYHSYLHHLKASGERFQVEYEFEVKPGWLPVNEGDTAMIMGKADLFLKDGPIVYAWDWKTGKVYPNHENQRQLYSAIIMGQHPDVEVVNFWHTYLDQHKNVHKVYYRNTDFGRIRDIWQAKMYKIETTPVEALMANPNPLCNYCGYRRAVGGPCIFGNET